MSKILIAYFSASGVTARTAKEMAKAAGADLYEICPAEPYTAADLNWMDQKSRSTLEMNDPACRPAIAAPAADLDQYDTVFLGYPNWWYGGPMAVLTFLEENDLSGNQVYLFCSHGTGGLANSVEILTQALPNATLSDNIFDCSEEEAAQSQQAIKTWVAGLGNLTSPQLKRWNCICEL